MRITLRQLAIFAAVADAGSTAAAADRVALSQSATSAALNELEAVLAARLFDRVGTRLVLNDTGRGLLPQARAVLDGAAGIERDFGLGATAGAHAAPPSLLRVGASTTIGNYLLPTLVANWQRARPAAHVDVRIANTGAVAAAVARMEVDIGLIEGPSHEPDVVVQAWREEELAIVCAPSHPLLGGDPRRRLNVATLRQAAWLLREPGSGTREAVEQALQPHLHQLREGLHFGGTEAIKQAAVEGLGFTCLSLFAVQDLVALGRLVRVDTTLPRLVRRLWLVHHRRKQFSRSLAAFIDFCQQG
ncbi:LysR family transcriptional regulator [Scleromatobacter humisilvae]|uniref:LysR family transcriptional regulator n=1 Tax=Scleromatobacter humisilvae TaxID=2897159 RepID=A0A9X1YT24_9BURK|nr:LysR family transcriptional regulator [Scleromatobacter humisilvae]MCK9689181.1 LysR family transcriptional regulator [Scleromatobacter humisilvae]